MKMRLHSFFFGDEKGILLAYSLSKHSTFTGLLMKASSRISCCSLSPRSGKSSRRFILQQDSAPPHCAAAVQATLEQNGIEVMEHPPYSPCLTPRNFHVVCLHQRIPARAFSSHVQRSVLPSSSMSNMCLLKASAQPSKDL